MENAIVEIDIFPSLAQDFSPAHPGIERAKNDPLQVFGRCCHEQAFFAQAQDRALGSAFPLHAQTAQGVRGKISFLDTPIENAAQDGDCLLYTSPSPRD